MSSRRPSPSSIPLRHLVRALAALTLCTLCGFGGAHAEPVGLPDDSAPSPVRDGPKVALAGDDESEGQDVDGELLDPDQCPALFGDEDDRDYNRRVREAKLTWLESRGGVVEITHTTSWRRPFYLELAGVALIETEPDGRGGGSAVVVVDDAVPDCEPGHYPLEPDFALGKQGRVIGVVDGSVLIDFEDRLAYLMTEDAEPPTWQMVWRSGWYFIRRREVTATKPTARRNRNRNTNRNRNRSSRSRRR